MLEAVVGQELAGVLVNAALLALWPVLPGLVFIYVRQASSTRPAGPDFSLRKSETAELDRAVRLYDTVRRRLDAIEATRARPDGVLDYLLARRPQLGAPDADEFEDLAAHAQHLRATIARLRRRPLQRLRAWIHVVSLHAGLGRALAADLAGLVLLIAAQHGTGQSALADEVTGGIGGALAWYPLDAQLFYANAVAASFAAGAAPVFYLLRRCSLRREYALEYCVLKEFAAADPTEAVAPSDADTAAAESPPGEDEVAAGDGWAAVLGVSPTATADEIKSAYKALIKTNHPDRVHGMAAAFRALAETETKKINAAYRQALVCVPAAPAR